MTTSTPPPAERAQLAEEGVVLPRRSPFLCRWFRWWVRGHLPKHFQAVRLSRGSRPMITAHVPVIVVLNHPSWWDPLVGIVLSELFPERAHYVPMDAKALERYSLFKRLGFYGVERGTAQGALAFLRTTTAILSQPDSMVWLTAQGQFADPRVRPPHLRSGIGHLIPRLNQAMVVTLALEYPFWDERLPEALARFGEPMEVSGDTPRSPSAWVELLEADLTRTQDALRDPAMTRNPALFETLLPPPAAGGGSKVWRHLWTRLRGQPVSPEHSVEGKGP